MTLRADYEDGGLSPQPDRIVATDMVAIANAVNNLMTTILTKGTYSLPSGGIPTTDLSAAVQALLAAASTALQAAVVVDNADGTLSIGSVNMMKPLSTIVMVATNATPAIAVTTVYSPQTAGANLAPTLLPLSSLRIGARFGIAHDPRNKSNYGLTFNTSGTDQFYPSLKAAGTFPLPGEQRVFEVVSVGGVKYWGPDGPLNPVAGLDNRYLLADGGNAQGSLYDGGNAAGTGYVSALAIDGGNA